MVHKKNQKQRARVEQTTLALEAMEKEVQNKIKYGVPISEKKDDQLFFVDKKGGSTVNRNLEFLTKAERILQSNPNIESMSTGTKHEKVDKKLMAPVEMKFKKRALNIKKEKSLLPNKPILEKIKSDLKQQSIDIWGSQDKINNNQNNNQNNTQNNKVKKRKGKKDNLVKKVIFDKNFKKITTIIDKDNDFITNNLLENRINKPTKANHPSVIKKVNNIEIAEPGMSYNPSYQDHQDTLGVALAKEILALEYVENVDKVLNPEIIEFEKEDGIEDDDDEENQNLDGKVDKPGERITKLEKNKRIRRAEEMKRQKLALQKKEFNKQVDEVLDTLQNVIEAEEVAKELNRKRVEKKSLNTMPRRLGKYKLSESAEPILLTHQLPNSLSNLRNDNYNPLKERYQSFQKRHVIEASGPQQKAKKATKKVYTSNSWNNTTVASLD
ncbi:hypothetical protein ACTA71_004035 [Dictyostelium dimigraforme]